MKANEIKEFLDKNSIEIHWYKYSKKLDDFLVFIPFYLITDFVKLFSKYDLEEDGISCVLKDCCFCFDLFCALENSDIEISEICTIESEFLY